MPQSGFQTYNEVKIRERTLGDQITGVLRDRPSYEENYVDMIRTHVSCGDRVVIVGGWHGVSAVAAARSVGEGGSVTVYEATKKRAERVARVSNLNNVSHVIEVKNRVVGSDVTDLKSEGTAESCVRASNFESCDVLALDCDGCELEVLEGFDGRPERIIVEHHGEGNDGDALKFKYDEQRLRDVLTNRGYEVSRFEVRSRVRYGFDDKIGWFLAKDGR